ERNWLCSQCGTKLERDPNSSINIERRGKIRCLGEAHPGARGKDEAVKGNETTMALIPGSRSPEAKPARSPVDLTEPRQVLRRRARPVASREGRQSLIKKSDWSRVPG